MVGTDGGNEADDAHNHHHQAKDDEHNGDVKGSAGDDVHIGNVCCLQTDGEGRGGEGRRGEGRRGEGMGGRGGEGGGEGDKWLNVTGSHSKTKYTIQLPLHT